MSGAAPDPVLIAARRALLDALDALADHRASIIVIGAQALYMHTGGLNLALAEETKDADIAVDSRHLQENPRVEQALRDARFYPDDTKRQPGAWCSPDGLPVDVMVPERFAGAAARNRRGARLPPHDNSSMRRAEGLEAALVDNEVREVVALDPGDVRRLDVKVAGPAALLVAKLFKIHEHIAQHRHLEAKDAHDVYRLLRAVPTRHLADKIRELLNSEVAGDVTRQALHFVRELFGDPDAPGSQLAGDAERDVGDPELVSQSVPLLVQDLLADLETS